MTDNSACWRLPEATGSWRVDHLPKKDPVDLRDIFCHPFNIDDLNAGLLATLAEAETRLQSSSLTCGSLASSCRRETVAKTTWRDGYKEKYPISLAAFAF